MLFPTSRDMSIGGVARRRRRWRERRRSRRHFSSFALEFFCVKPFSFVVRPAAAEEEEKGKTLSFALSKSSNVLPVLRRQAVDLLLHRGRGLLRRV